jgi:dihydroorotase
LSFDLLIKNAQIVSSAGTVKADVGVKGGKIKLVGDAADVSAKETIEAAGLLLFPGIIDTQVHFREPGPTHKETIETGSMAAALGGVTTFFEMPNTNPSTTSEETINQKIEIAKKNSYVNFGFFMGATGNNTEELLKIPHLPGCPGIKIFLGSSTGDLLLHEPEKLKEIFSKSKSVIALHSEDELMLVARSNIRDQAKSVHDHEKWRNWETAFSSSSKVIELAKQCKRKVHLLHITTKQEVELIENNKSFCTAEVTPQHLTLFAPDCYDGLGTYAQMNPPIRDIEHQEALWEGLRRNVFYVIGSDHAPHTREEKDKGYPHSPSGMPGVQTLLPIMLEHAFQGRLTVEKLCELVCENPSKLYHLKTKGHIKEGFDADLTLVDFTKEVTIQNEKMASKCGWTPFHGMKVHGDIKMTIVNGHIVMRDGQLLDKGHGKPI